MRGATLTRGELALLKWQVDSIKWAYQYGFGNVHALARRLEGIGALLAASQAARVKAGARAHLRIV